MGGFLFKPSGGNLGQARPKPGAVCPRLERLAFGVKAQHAHLAKAATDLGGDRSVVEFEECRAVGQAHFGDGKFGSGEIIVEAADI